MDSTLRLGRRWLKVTNALPYYNTELITSAKSFIVHALDFARLHWKNIFDADLEIYKNNLLDNNYSGKLLLEMKSAMTFGIMTYSIMTFSINGLKVTFSIKDTQHNNALPLCWVSLCKSRFICYAVIMLNVIILSVVAPNKEQVCQHLGPIHNTSFFS
jgi:hypothetical protein